MSKANSRHVVTAGGGLFFDDAIHGRLGLRAPPPARAPSIRRAPGTDRAASSGRAAAPTFAASPSAYREAYIREAAARTVRGSPEIIARILGSGKTIGDARSQVAYVAKDSAGPLEDERGKQWRGERVVERATRTWQKGGMGLPETGTRRETFHVLLWTPEGTDKAATMDAARATLRAEFDGHRYLFAAHHDTPHPHVHAVVVIGRTDGRARLNPRKVDLAVWRESFAQELRARGVDANATRREVRGVLAREEARGKKPVVASIETHRAIEREWEQLARKLDGGDGAARRLAAEVRAFVERMPARAREREREIAAPSVAPDR